MAKAEETKKKKTPTAKKRDIQNKKKRLRNKEFKTQVRTSIRKLEDAIQKADPVLVKEALNGVYSMMDQGVKKGLYKQNKASRTKSRLTAKSAKIS